MNIQEARAQFQADKAQFEALGVIFPDAQSYIPDGAKRDYRIAMDAQPGLTTSANSAIPAFLSTYIDPTIYEVLFAANVAKDILGERKEGVWTTQTAMFPVVEHAGEVSSYGDFAESGKITANTAFPQRQSYLYQTIVEYGDLEVERVALAKINWVSEIMGSAADIMAKYQNFTYFYGIGGGLENYGLFNDPNLSASLTPAPKAAGGNKWITNGVITATANEIYADIQSLVIQLIAQSAGLITQDTPMVLALSPASKFALTATNSFNVNVEKLLKDNIPNLRIIAAVQYGANSTVNPQGFAAGNFAQLIAPNVGGQQTGYAAFNEKMRSHPIVRALSSWRQKITGGSWGAVLRQPFAIASMLGI
jgi:hypothetical protein